MTERERLIEICEDLILSCKASLCTDCEHNKIDYPHCMGVHFADHLLSNGVIVPPVKAGDKLFRIVDMPYTLDSVVSKITETVEPYSIVYKNILGGYSCIPFDEFGKTVFLSKKEAEKALKEKQK